MKRKEAINSIFNSVSDTDITVSTTGLISREIYTKFDSDRNIYVPGSMGLVSSIGLSIAICCPNRRIIIIDGDASLLMNFGSLVTIGSQQPQNLLHIVLDNGAYGSCSEERSLSSFANFDKIVKVVGFRYIKTVYNELDLENAIKLFKHGPGFILSKIKLGGRRDFSRPLRLVEIKKRFMKFIQNYQGEKYGV